MLKAAGLFLVLVGLATLIAGGIYVSRTSLSLVSVSPAPTPTPPIATLAPTETTSFQISLTGNLVNQSGRWVLVYEAPGSPALSVNLQLTPQSLCTISGKSGPCSPAAFSSGLRVKITGNLNSDTFTVARLESL